MANTGSYPIRSFSENQTFLVYDPSTSTTARVRGADLIDYITPSLNVVRTESTTDGAANEDYKVGSVIQTTGQSAPGDGQAGLFLVVPAGDGDLPMLNGNELLTIAGDAFLRSQLNNGIVRFDLLSDMESTPGRFDGDSARLMGYSALSDGGEGNFRWGSSDLSPTLILSSVTSTSVDDTTDTVTSTAHGLEDGDGVVSQTAVNGLSLNTVYYVVNSTTDTYQLSETFNGVAFDLTGTTNFTVDHLLDPLKGIYVTSPTDLTGTGGAWVRSDVNILVPEWFGAFGTGVLNDDTPAIQAALNYAQIVGGEVRTSKNREYGVTGVSETSANSIINFEGKLVPFGSTTGYLYFFGGDITERNADSGNSTWLPRKIIKNLRIDGLGVSRGAHIKYVDHGSLKNIKIDRTSGNPLKIELVRETDFFATEITLCDASAQSEPNLWFYDTDVNIPSSPTPFPDATNNVRFHGLNIVHCNGTYMRFSNLNGTAGERQRNIDFYGAQLHHYDDQPRNLSPITLDDGNPVLLRNESGYNIRFHGGNLRIPGNDVSITSGKLVENATGGTFPTNGGYTLPVENEIIFLGTRLSTENTNATVITATVSSGFVIIDDMSTIATENGAVIVNQAGNKAIRNAGVSNILTNVGKDLLFDTSDTLKGNGVFDFNLGDANSRVGVVQMVEFSAEPSATAGAYAASDGTASTNGFGTAGRGLYRFNGATWTIV